MFVLRDDIMSYYTDETVCCSTNCWLRFCQLFFLLTTIMIMINVFLTLSIISLQLTKQRGQFSLHLATVEEVSPMSLRFVS